MLKSKKKKNQEHQNTEKKTSSANAEISVTAHNSSSANLQKGTPDIQKDAPASDVNVTMSNVVTQPDLNEKKGQVQYLQEGYLTASYRDQTLTPKMEHSEQQLLGRIQDLENQVHSLRIESKELVHQKEEMMNKEQENTVVAKLSALLTVQFKWYFTFQKKIITDNVNHCKKMITDLTATLSYLSYSPLSGILSLSECHQNLDEWKLELQKSEKYWNIFEELQQQVYNSLRLGNFAALPELSPFIHFSRPNDILHDNFVLVIKNELDKCQKNESLMSTPRHDALGTNQLLSSAASSSSNLLRACASSTINTNTNKEQASCASHTSDLVIGETTKNENLCDHVWFKKNIVANCLSASTQSIQNHEKNVQTELPSEVDDELDKIWLKKIRRIHANCPSDTNKDILNHEKTLPLRLTCMIDNDLDSIWLKKIRRIHANSSDDREENISNRINNKPPVFEELHKSNPTHVNNGNSKILQDEVHPCRIQKLENNSVPSASACSSMGGHSDQEFSLSFVKSLKETNFHKLYMYVRERIPQSPEVEILSALKAVRQKRSRLSGMTKDHIVFAVEAELRNTGCTASADIKVVRKPEQECVICLQPYGESATTTMTCLHTFHYDCLKWWLSNEPICPLCRRHISQDDNIFKLP